MTALWYALAVFAGILIGAFFTWVGWCRHTTRWQIAAQLLAVFFSRWDAHWGCDRLGLARCNPKDCIMYAYCDHEQHSDFTANRLLEAALDAAERQVGP